MGLHWVAASRKAELGDSKELAQLGGKGRGGRSGEWDTVDWGKGQGGDWRRGGGWRIGLD